jgi:hypothetical protein
MKDEYTYYVCNSNEAFYRRKTGVLDLMFQNGKWMKSANTDEIFERLLTNQKYLREITLAEFALLL